MAESRRAGSRELDNDNYFTIDSPWIIPALMSKVPIAGSVLEPAAGLGHMVIELRRGHGLAVTASDLHAYPDPLIPDIEIRDLRSIDTLSGFNWAITNLPYRDQDVLAAHLVELGARPDSVWTACGFEIGALRSPWRAL